MAKELPKLSIKKTEGKTIVTFTIPGKGRFEDMEREYTYYEVADSEIDFAVRHTLLDEAFSLLSDVQEAAVRGDEHKYIDKWVSIAKAMIGYELSVPYTQGPANNPHKYYARTSPLIC